MTFSGFLAPEKAKNVAEHLKNQAKQGLGRRQHCAASYKNSSKSDRRRLFCVSGWKTFLRAMSQTPELDRQYGVTSIF
jgi:hypothetical protein